MPGVGVVIIGRNEGPRLLRCIRSVEGSFCTVYVDSGSNDGSVDAARGLGVRVVELDRDAPFTASRARNRGVAELLDAAPGIEYVQFVDGDCTLEPGWIAKASATLAECPDVAAVCGRLRERHPEQSVYNRLCDIEWDGMPGEVEACGGIAMMRLTTFQAAGGFRDSLIAGEEPELCARFRLAGGKIIRLPCMMAWHDAAMTSWRQWWRRAVRSGHAYAEVSRLHDGRHSWSRAVRSNYFWGLALPLGTIAAASLLHPLALAALPILFAGMIAKIAISCRRRMPSSHAILYAIHCMLAKFPMAIGQLIYCTNRWTGRTQPIIEYKAVAAERGGK